MTTDTDQITITMSRRAAQFYIDFIAQLTGSSDGPRGEVVDSVWTQLRAAGLDPFNDAGNGRWWKSRISPITEGNHTLIEEWPSRLAAQVIASGTAIPPRDVAPAFWLVWREDGDAPKRKHYDEAQAKQEAERLAERNPGVRFFIAPVSRFAIAEVLPVKFSTATSDEEIPF